MRYHFQAEVERKVLDTIILSVETDDGFRAAFREARKALHQYPSEVENSKGIKFMYTENRVNLDTDIVRIERKVPTNDDGAA